MTNVFLDYFRCPEEYASSYEFTTDARHDGYFRFGDLVCYGRHDRSEPSLKSHLYDVEADVQPSNGVVHIPFNLQQVVTNLRYERYAAIDVRAGKLLNSSVARLYFVVRPALPLAIRRRILKRYLSKRKQSKFPKWPVDTTVDQLMWKIMSLWLKCHEADRIPFIWFWPNGAPACSIMTHDVEAEGGRKFCSALMDIDESFGIRSSFQLVPESRYLLSEEFLEMIRQRGCEINIHDLNHDGLLFKSREEFLRRTAQINAYFAQLQAVGFRSAILFRRQEWLDVLKCEYDMSVPNVGRLDPQRGGCCTVMPYFVSNLLELPVTTTQDYSLFYILQEYSLDLWKKQIDIILKNHGLISNIVHPDYIHGRAEQNLYKELLAYLSKLRAEKNVWCTTPGEVNRWWRQRAGMKLVKHYDGWHVEGIGAERARIAYAELKNGDLKVTIEERAQQGPCRSIAASEGLS